MGFPLFSVELFLVLLDSAGEWSWVGEFDVLVCNGFLKLLLKVISQRVYQQQDTINLLHMLAIFHFLQKLFLKRTSKLLSSKKDLLPAGNTCIRWRGVLSGFE